MEQNQSNNTGLILVIGIISLVALVLAWTAYNRSGEDVTAQVEQGVAELAMETQQNTNEVENEIEMATSEVVGATQDVLIRAEARAELVTLQAELEAEENYMEAATEVAQLRAELNDTYQNATGEVQMQWQELDQGLEQFEQSARTESADALEVLGGLIIMLEADVRTDQE